MEREDLRHTPVCHVSLTHTVMMTWQVRSFAMEGEEADRYAVNSQYKTEISEVLYGDRTRGSLAALLHRLT